MYDRLEAIQRDLARKRPRANILCRNEEVPRVAEMIGYSNHSAKFSRVAPFSDGWSVFRNEG